MTAPCAAGPWVNVSGSPSGSVPVGVIASAVSSAVVTDWPAAVGAVFAEATNTSETAFVSPVTRSEAGDSNTTSAAFWVMPRWFEPPPVDCAWLGVRFTRTVSSAVRS